MVSSFLPPFPVSESILSVVPARSLVHYREVGTRDWRSAFNRIRFLKSICKQICSRWFIMGWLAFSFHIESLLESIKSGQRELRSYPQVLAAFLGFTEFRLAESGRTSQLPASIPKTTSFFKLWLFFPPCEMRAQWLPECQSSPVSFGRASVHTPSSILSVSSCVNHRLRDWVWFCLFFWLVLWGELRQGFRPV